MLKTFIIFLVLNFAALGFGSYFTGDGVISDWYQDLNKAPWTPPGWVFGAAWTTIMICFAGYMTYLYRSGFHKQTIVSLFALQWLLNFSWNPTFFYLHKTVLALVFISLLTLLISYLLFKYAKALGARSVLILPYFIWLLIATSLNAYIIINN